MTTFYSEGRAVIEDVAAYEAEHGTPRLSHTLLDRVITGQIGQSIVRRHLQSKMTWASKSGDRDLLGRAGNLIRRMFEAEQIEWALMRALVRARHALRRPEEKLLHALFGRQP